MPAHGLPVVEVDTGTVSKGSKGTQEVVRQDRGVLQGVHHDHQDRWELRGLQEALGSETVEVLQMGRQKVWVHVKGSHLGPKVGVDEVVEGRNCHCCLRRHWSLRQVVHDWVVGKPLQEEVRSWEDFRTTGGAAQQRVPN